MGAEGGGGVLTRTRASAGRGLGVCAERCHPQTSAAQSTLNRRTDIEAVGETRRQTHAGHGLSALPHTCALRSVRLGQWGGSGFGGQADPEVCQYLWCHNTDLCTRQRLGGGGGGGRGGEGYLVPPQQLSNAEVPRGQGHAAWDEAAVVTNTRHGRRTGGGGGPAVWHAACPPS